MAQGRYQIVCGRSSVTAPVTVASYTAAGSSPGPLVAVASYTAARTRTAAHVAPVGAIPRGLPRDMPDLCPRHARSHARGLDAAIGFEAIPHRGNGPPRWWQVCPSTRLGGSFLAATRPSSIERDHFREAVLVAGSERASLGAIVSSLVRQLLWELGQPSWRESWLDSLRPTATRRSCRSVALLVKARRAGRDGAVLSQRARR